MIGIVADTHLGQQNQQLTALRKFYQMATEDGCSFVLHAGDLIDGVSMRPGHQFECFIVGADNIIKYVVEKYPSDLPTYLIGGNHDESTRKLAGFDILEEICRQRPDIHFLGYHEAHVSLEGVKIALYHGVGMGAASNRLMKTFGEACRKGTPPDLLINGHLHQWSIKPFHGAGDAFLIQAPALQGTTDFMKRKLITPDIGGIIWEPPVKGVCAPRFLRYKERFNDT